MHFTEQRRNQERTGKIGWGGGEGEGRRERGWIGRFKILGRSVHKFKELGKCFSIERCIVNCLW